MFQKLKNRDTAYMEIRRIAILAICSCSFIGIVAQAYNYAKMKRLQNQIYVLADGKVMQAYVSTREANIEVEAKDHIRNFHQYFFSLDPDNEQIQKSIRKALYLADNSVKKAFDNLSKQGYYIHIISSNTGQRMTIDSIQIELQRHPYTFRCYVTTELIITSGKITRKLITEGKLRTVSRSEENPHGFLIENWKLVENKDHTKY